MSEDELAELTSPHLDNAVSSIQEAFRIAEELLDSGEVSQSEYDELEEFIKTQIKREV